MRFAPSLGRSMAVWCVFIAAGAGCSRKVARGPTPEEQGYLPSDFRAHVEFVSQGIVDWGNHRFLCRVSVPLVDKTVAGEPLSRLVAENQAYDAAGVIASRVAVNLASGLRVDARDTLSNFASDDATLRTWGHVSGRQLVKKGRKLNGDMEYVFQVPMLGVNGVVSKVYERARRSVSQVGVLLNDGAPRSAHVVELDSGVTGFVPSPLSRAAMSLAAARPGAWEVDRRLIRPKYAPNTSGASIIVDARGTGLKPALFPAIRDETNALVFSVASARRNAVVEGGLVQYVELPASRGNGLRRDRAVVVVARAAAGPLMADVVVSAADAVRIRAEAGSLSEARVIVVMDARSE
jgi:hypothetical protein